jgi:hypothetical protein
MYCITCALLLSLTVTAQYEGFHRCPPHKLKGIDISTTICKAVIINIINIFIHKYIIPYEKEKSEQKQNACSFLLASKYFLCWLTHD